jgi:hypothetical protein
MTKADICQFMAKPKLAMGAIRAPGKRSSFCAALPGERVVGSGGRKVLVLPIDLRVAATPYASCRNIFIDPAGT